MDTNNKTEIPKPEVKVKKNNKKWWIAGGCGCALIALIVVAIIVSLISLGGLKLFKSIQAPVAPIKGQLKATNDGDIEKAYNDYSSNGFKRNISFENFKLIVENNPSVFKSKSSSFTDIKINNSNATVKGTVTGKDGTVDNMTYTCVYENNKWKIYGFKDN